MGPVRESAPQALVILGCKVRAGKPGAAMLRRLERGLLAWKDQQPDLVVMSGGFEWQGHRESTVMAKWWQQHSPVLPLLEDRSSTTSENALQVAALVRERHISRVLLVTCDFHMKRAARLFRQQNLEVTEVPAPSRLSPWRRAMVDLREWGAARLEPWQRFVE